MESIYSEEFITAMQDKIKQIHQEKIKLLQEIHELKQEKLRLTLQLLKHNIKIEE